MTRLQHSCLIHVDMDGYEDICRVHGWKFAGGADRLFETGLQNALELFARHQIKAAFFVIAKDLENPAKRAALRAIVDQGHEIGSHTITHRKLGTLPSTEKRKEIRESRLMLEDALGVQVRGFRAPGFDMDRECLQFLDENGYAYDSSLFPGRAAPGMGVASISDIPHRIEGSLVELPLPAYAPLPFPFHPSYSLVLGNWYFRMGLGRLKSNSAPLVLLFHLVDFADPIPRNELPAGWKAKVFTLSFLNGPEKLNRCQSILERVRKQYSIERTSTLMNTMSSDDVLKRKLN